ncbi:MAG: CoA pyrophosphatase [Halieaceae bacterium]|jgi:8-oxo-dGTP pyrophosphatase MutT (NUDIX family)|nr:CoA pyrophosphatase [Halieaceae bacterium]
MELKQAIQRLQRHERPRHEYGPVQRRAAVAIALHEGESGIDVLMIQRARRAGDPWSGHMGFPGGRRDAEDHSNLACALRETREELGFDLQASGELITELGEVNTGWRPDRPEMLVSPFVFALHERPTFEPNYEVDEVVWFPLAFLMDRSNRHDHHWEWRGDKLVSDAYIYRGKRVWGLSLMMLDELMAALER